MNVRVEWGTQTVSSYPRVSLSASVTRAAVAARAHKQGSQAQEMASSCFDKPPDGARSPVTESGPQ
jgi:hypothetical protein